MNPVGKRMFSIDRPAMEATRNGMFGGPTDPYQVLVPGLKRFSIDGERVTEEEFKRLARIEAEALELSLEGLDF